MRNLQVMQRSREGNNSVQNFIFWEFVDNFFRIYKDFEQDDEGTFSSFEDLYNSDIFEGNESEEIEEYDDFDIDQQINHEI